jgi:hypothetical protein
MANRYQEPSQELLQSVFKNYELLGSKKATARVLGLAETTVRRWLKRYYATGTMGVFKMVNVPGGEGVDEIVDTLKHCETDILKDKIKTLESVIAASKKESLTDHYVREKIFGLSEVPVEPPKWLTSDNDFPEWEAVPTVFLSDLHWGEVVDPNQIGGVNSYDLEIASERLKSVVNTSCSLLDMVDGRYPGIVVALGGDLLSGDIHEELSETNAAPMMPVLLNLLENLIATLNVYADKFGKVFVPCVTGNHSRTSKKPRAKSRNFTNFDWLLYTLLDRHFKSDNRITFQIPDGSDALYKVYNTRYLLTHGDQMRSSGEAMIGAIGSIIRGDHRKRSRNGQINMSYDCMLLGHWHQLIQMQRLIVNGSLKGYDEYAYVNNFGYEPPRQAMWLTHKEHGIIMSMPVNADRHHDENKYQPAEWVSWKP